MGKVKVALITVGSIVAFISILLLCILLPLSYGTLENDEIGLIYHGYTKRLERELRGEGRHYLGDPAAKILKYKRTFVQLVFDSNVNESAYANLAETDSGGDISCYSSDGIAITIQASLQYKIPSWDTNGTEITLGLLGSETDPRYANYSADDPPLYVLVMEFGDDFEGLIINSCRRAVIDACGSQKSTVFYYNRGAIEALFQSSVEGTVSDLGLGVTVSLFQLTDVALPDSFSNSISLKEQARTDIPRAQNERIQALIQSNTRVENERLKAELSIYTSEQNAIATATRASTTAQVTLITNNATASELLTYSSNFTFTPNDLLRFLAIEKLGSASDLAIGLKAPAFFGYNST
jgi:hypothetical protein